MSFVLVSFHAHPDGEALLTAGTLARAAAEGHRVVLVTATHGAARTTCPRPGVARVVHLGHLDTGYRGRATGGPRAFSVLDPIEAATPLAELLRDEGAHVLTTYDPAGGYGHPDRRQVHAVGAVAARLAGTPTVLEATAPRDLLVRGARLARAARLLDAATLARLEDAYSARDEITHRVDVSAYAAAKRAALAAQASRTAADGSSRTLRLLLGLPGRLVDRVLCHEWYVDRSAPAPGRIDDVFAAVRRADR